MKTEHKKHLPTQMTLTEDKSVATLRERSTKREDRHASVAKRTVATCSDRGSTR